MTWSIFLFPLLFWGAILGGGFYLGIRLLRVLENRNSGGVEIDDLRKRMAHLEESMESMGREVGRIGESQDFTTKLLTERPESKPRDGEDT